ncbi:MAG: methyltransferase domain-containing protein, partial [bacterium]
MLTVDFERLALRPGMTVLDAGCGQGRHSLELLRRGCHALALDLNLEDLKYTRFLLSSILRGEAASGPEGGEASNRQGVSDALDATDLPAAPLPPPYLVLRGNAQSLPFRAASFDRVLCSEVLEHVDDPRRAAAELARVLKPGGMLAASVPTPATEWLYRFSSDDYFNTPGGHVRIFSMGRLRKLLAGQGLEVIDLHFEHAFHSIYWWVRCVFGLHAENHPAIRHCKKILTHVMFSPALVRAERWSNWV